MKLNLRKIFSYSVKCSTIRRSRGVIDALLIVSTLGLLGCEELVDQAETSRSKSVVSLSMNEYEESGSEFINKSNVYQDNEKAVDAEINVEKVKMASIMQVERISSGKGSNFDLSTNVEDSADRITVNSAKDNINPATKGYNSAEFVNVLPEESTPEVKIVPFSKQNISEVKEDSESGIIGASKTKRNDLTAMASPEIISGDSQNISESDHSISVQRVKILNREDENSSNIDLKPVTTVIGGDSISIGAKSKDKKADCDVSLPSYSAKNGESIVIDAPDSVVEDYKNKGKRSFFGLFKKSGRRKSSNNIADNRISQDKPFDTSTAFVESGGMSSELSHGKNSISENSDSAPGSKILEMQDIQLADAGKAVISEKNQADIKRTESNSIDSVADKELKRIMVRRQLKQLQAERKLIKGRKLFDSQEYEAALRLFKDAEALDPESEKVQEAIRMTQDLVEGTGVQSREQLADKVMRQAVAREQYSAVQLRRLIDSGEKLLNEVQNGTVDTVDLDKVDLLSLNKGKVEDALDKIAKVELLLQGEVGGGVARADIKARCKAVNEKLHLEQDRINAELEAISRTETLRSARASASKADETLKNQVNNLMKSAKYYFELDNFAKTMSITEEVLKLDPNYTAAKSLHDQARNYEHDRRYSKAEKDLKQAEDEWILDVEEMSIPNSTIVTYPEDWESIKLRAKRSSLDSNREAWKQRMQEKLDTQKISIDFDKMPFKDVIQYFVEYSGINIVMDKTVDPDYEVTISVSDMTLGTALNWVLKLTPQRYYHEMRNEALYISSAPKSEVYMNLYPVYDLTHSAKDYNGPQVDTTLEVGKDGEDGDLGEGLFGDDDDDDGGEEEGEDSSIIENITKHIAPSTWESEDNAGKVSINMWQDNLLVMQTASVHAQIAEYLNGLRASKKQQVLVGTRFLNISEDFLEDIGVRWQDDVGQSALALPDLPGGDAATPGLGMSDWAERNAASGGDFGRYGKHYTSGMQIVPGAGAANYNANGGIRMDMKYLSRQILNDFEVNAVLEAVRTNRKGSILHNPKLIVANGRNAFMEVRSQTNYVAEYDVVDGGLEPQVESYSQGVVFDVKPVISFDKKYVTVRMRPAMSSLIGQRNINIVAERTRAVGNNQFVIMPPANYTLQLPQLALTRIWTYATVPNGGSVMLGGLIRDVRNEEYSGVPLVSNLPLIGRLTKSNSKTREKENLLLIVTSKIIELDQ